jgi:hypothetical protein
MISMTASMKNYKVFNQFPTYHMEILVRDFIEKVGTTGNEQ